MLHGITSLHSSRCFPSLIILNSGTRFTHTTMWSCTLTKPLDTCYRTAEIWMEKSTRVQMSIISHRRRKLTRQGSMMIHLDADHQITKKDVLDLNQAQRTRKRTWKGNMMVIHLLTQMNQVKKTQINDVI